MVSTFLFISILCEKRNGYFKFFIKSQTAQNNGKLETYDFVNDNYIFNDQLNLIVLSKFVVVLN